MENLKTQLTFLKETEVKEIIEEARKLATKLINDAQAKAKQIKAKETEKILQQVQQIEEQELEAAKVEEKRKMANYRFQLIEGTLAKSFERLREIADKGDPSYRKCLEQLVVEAGAKIKGAEIQAIFNPRDLVIVKRNLKRIEKEIAHVRGTPVILMISDEPLVSIGGVVVRSKDGTEIFNNTLEARLAKVKQEMLVEISEILFEGADV